KLADADKKDEVRGCLLAGNPELPEADDDPHRLARVFLLSEGMKGRWNALRFWRQDWYEWDGTAYRQLDREELRARLNSSIKAEFDRIFPQQLAAWEIESNGEEKTSRKPRKAPKVMKVSDFLVGNVLQALAGMLVVPTKARQPVWLQGEGPHPAEEM